MRAVQCYEKELQLINHSDLQPQKGQALLEVVRCGICGSDLHMQHHCDHMSDLSKRAGYDKVARSTDKVIFGHEFCGNVLDYGPQTKHKIKTGRLVCAFPMLRIGKEYYPTGLSAPATGAYAEQTLAQASLLFEVPNGLDADSAALTEPMAVALHAVRRSNIKKRDVAIVIGCGPVGLGVVCMLKALGVHTVVASDFSPKRRALALACGADIIIDPKEKTPFDDWKDFGFLGDMSEALTTGLGFFEKIDALNLPWWHAWRVGEKLGVTPKRPVIFECVGAPGVLQHIINGAPIMSRIVVVGVCMESDRIEPALAVNKELEMRFAMASTPLDYRDALHMIAEGKVNCKVLHTGTVGLEGVSAAFDALKSAEYHAKILINPKQTGTTII